jgi:lipoprotein LprG
MGQRLEGIQFVVVDGVLYAALTPGSGLQDFGPAADIYDVSAILDPNRGLANILANFTDAKADARETIEGTETVRVTGTVSAEAVNAIAPQLGATGPVPATAWIADNDKKELVQAKLEPREGVSITMTFTEWGKPVTVTKPAV